MKTFIISLVAFYVCVFISGVFVYIYTLSESLAMPANSGCSFNPVLFSGEPYNQTFIESSQRAHNTSTSTLCTQASNRQTLYHLSLILLSAPLAAVSAILSVALVFRWQGRSKQRAAANHYTFQADQWWHSTEGAPSFGAGRQPGTISSEHGHLSGRNQLSIKERLYKSFAIAPSDEEEETELGIGRYNYRSLAILESEDDVPSSRSSSGASLVTAPPPAAR